QRRLRFPQAEPPQAALSEPQALAWDEARWRERIVAEADPLKAAQLQAQRARTLAQRASADRVADPTVGVYAASEALRNERIVGLSVTIPLGGEYRRERSLQLLREADALEAATALQRQRIELEVARTYAQAEGAGRRWQLAEQSAAASLAATRLTQRAYTLGEADLQALLLARRQALEARRSALEARTDALRGLHRLLVDAHLVWGLERD
ncbi:MAG: TolC family protein, partial [Comamonadaceae bacterium]